MQNSKSLLFCASAALVFSACGDDVTEVTGNPYMTVLESGEKLSKQSCTSENAGEMLFVMDSSAAFVCNGEEWLSQKGADGKNGEIGKDGEAGAAGMSCSAKTVKNSDGTLEGVELSCGDIVVDTIWNGKDGESGTPGKDGIDGSDGVDGKNGKNGASGASCTAERVQKDGLTGYELTCGKDVVDTIWNGADGKNGSNGKDGLSCSAQTVVNSAGLKGIEVSCGKTVIDTLWNGEKGELGPACVSEKQEASAAHVNGGYRITCGMNGFDLWNGNDGVSPQVSTDDPCQFTDNGDGTVNVTCGSSSAVLNVATCGDELFDLVEQFCYEDKLYNRCAGKIYNPEKQYCNDESDITDFGFFKDSRDNQTYRTVEINGDIWMADNLNYADSVSTPNLEGNSWYAEKLYTGEPAGRFYTWTAAMNLDAEYQTESAPATDLISPVKGICPDGWHLPDIAEWGFLAGIFENHANDLLKESAGWFGTVSNSSGFSIVPTGYFDGKYTLLSLAMFWAAYQENDEKAGLWYAASGEEDISSDSKGNGYSVRCVKDKTSPS